MSKPYVWDDKAVRYGAIFALIFSTAAPILFIPQKTHAAIAVRASVTAENGAGATNISFSNPAGVVAGDVMILNIVASPAESATIQNTAGWTLIGGGASASSTDIVQSFYRVVTSTEPASYTFSFIGTDTCTTNCTAYNFLKKIVPTAHASHDVSAKAALGIVAFSGVDNTAPVEVSAIARNDSSASTSVTAPTVTTTSANAMLVSAFGIFTSATFTPPADMTEGYDVTSSGGGAAGTKVAISSGYVVQATAGASGSRTATASAADFSGGHMIALTPAADGGGGGGLPAPTALSQKRGDNASIMPVGGASNDDISYFSFTMTSSVAETLTPEMEVRPIGTAFTGTPTHTGTGVACNKTQCANGVSGTVSVNTLDPNSYHWQARTNGSSSGVGSWVSYPDASANAETVADFILVPNAGLMRGGKVYTNGTLQPHCSTNYCK